MATVLYPLPAFHFTVSFDGADSDVSFQDVSGLQVELESEEVHEGGQNRFVHRLPTRTKYSNLMLKRGVVAGTSPLVTWLSQCFSQGPSRRVDAKTIVVQLLDRNGSPKIVWTVAGAYPARWEHSAMEAEESKLLIETVEFHYQYFDRKSLR